MSSRPAYKSFVVGECTDQEAAEKLPQYRHFFEWVMYRRINESNDRSSFYHPGYQKFLYQVRQAIQNSNNIKDISREDEGIVKYYYNRQLIVQMTMHPQPNGNDQHNPFYVSVPLYKAPYYELQTDILQLLPEQSKVNYNIRYMVVIVDTFTRFIWCCPVANLKAIKVQKAFLSALNRPGNSNANYEFLRDKVKRVVVDGGSELKSVFPEAVKLYFPNAEIITSNAKNRTGNRPTGNGPIEAAIRLLRLVMRDYSLGISPNFLGTENNIQHFGLSKMLQTYNETPQISLHEKSPIQVTGDTMAPKNSERHDSMVSTYFLMEKHRREQIGKKRKYQDLSGGNQFTTNRNGSFAYRIYKPPGQFAKQVDIRASLKAYVVDKLNSSKPPYVDLIVYSTGTDTLKRVLWNTLHTRKNACDEWPSLNYARLLENY